MSTFVYMTRCDGCGHCVDICPSDIMHIALLAAAYSLRSHGIIMSDLTDSARGAIRFSKAGI